MGRFEAALAGARQVGFTVRLDEHLAGGGVHPAAVHGRPGRAAVPRVRRDALGRGADLAADLAHHHADDVRLPAARQGRAEAGRAASPRFFERRLRPPAQGLRAEPRLRALGQAADDADPGRGDRAERLPLHGHPQGLLPEPGLRAAERRPARRPVDLLGGDGPQDEAARGDPDEGPGGRRRWSASPAAGAPAAASCRWT